MTSTKRLLIRASSSFDGDYSVLPINSGEFVELHSEIGVFSLAVFIKNFDGCDQHKDNSFYNVGDDTLLNGQKPSRVTEDLDSQLGLSNLSILVKFTPKAAISGSDLLFGNDCPTPIKNHIPVTILSSGLKFFTWFINPTIKADLYSENPYLYGLALNSFTNIGKWGSFSMKEVLTKTDDGLDSEDREELKLTSNAAERQKLFCDKAKCEKFTFRENEDYYLIFGTNFLRIGDSKYHVAIPTFGGRTFDIDVSRYADDTLNNFNWTIKKGGSDGSRNGVLGLLLNFALVEEDH